MADEMDVKKKKDTQQEKTDKESLVGRYLPWITMAVVVVFCAGAGLGLGRLFGRSGTDDTAELSQQTERADTQSPTTAGSEEDWQKTWYYDFEPVVANLNEPGATRYIRAALTLQISSEVEQKKGLGLLQEKIPVLKSWLTIYLASQTLEDVRGDRNLMRIQSEILDAFNEKLFPNAKPKIKHILLKEFAVQ